MPVRPWGALNKNASLEPLFPGPAPGLAVLHALELPLRERVKDYCRYLLPVMQHQRINHAKCSAF